MIWERIRSWSGSRNRFWRRCRHFLVAIAIAFLGGRDLTLAEAFDPRVGFPDWSEVCRRVEEIGQASSWCRIESLGKTQGDRPIWLMKLGTGRTENRPALLIVAGADAEQFSSSAVALSLANRLIADAESGGRWKQVLERSTVYLMPVASPDAYAGIWDNPIWERNRNARPWDEDGDGLIDEDGPEDIDGDGKILTMRIVDPEGEWVAHPQDERVLVPFEPADAGRVRYRIVSEGLDNDHDGAVNEDPAGGTVFNRNFPFEYPFFAPEAGPWQVSEPETQAAADLLLRRGNIAAVVVLGTGDNMLKPWTPDSSADNARIKKRILAADAIFFDPLAKFYRETMGFSDQAESRPEGGSFHAWAYFHAGRWAFAARMWVPKAAEEASAKSPAEDEDAVREGSRPDSAPKAKPDATEDKRGRFARDSLAFWEARGVRAFVPWRRFDHPDYPGRRVEIGGMVPGTLWNPPPDLVEELATKHEQLVARIVEAFPRLRIARASLEPLGGGLFRLTAEVENVGTWPTMPKMGEINREPYPVRVELSGEGWDPVQGFRKTLLPRLQGNGGREELRWILRQREDAERFRVQVTAAAPQVGRATKTLESPAE
ncbi:MAG: M14 family metallopeptidase [Thermogutta sp.]